MPAPKRALFLLLFGTSSFFATNCTGDLDDQPAMAARPGATQKGGDGPLLEDDEACERIRAVEEDVRRDLNCPDLERPDCPEYIRVGGSGCWMYPEDSVEACERAIGDYATCADFADEPCIVTAVAADPSECEGAGTGGSSATGGTGPGGEGGGGSAGRGGTAGRGGSAGSVGSAGEGGESGRASGGEGGV